jgi:cullin 4
VQNIVQDVSLDDDMVQRLLDFKTVADATLITAFTDNASEKENSTYPTQFYYALIDAFQTGFRARRNKPAEMIAKYMDSALREPTIDASNQEFEKRVDAALALYRFTDDKDVFRTFYHRALAKRLLLGRTVTDDAEKHVLKKLEERGFPPFF